MALLFYDFFKKLLQFLKNYAILFDADTRPVGQAAKTPPSHGGNGGSIPPRVTNPESFGFRDFFV